ncbi:uncharacterized protein LOC121685760 isoform X2 [Alosa sapidissima]|uniref:uncharacterized protein LOC121685760 isoform X2 n=1 Tax=Alosa sapidissima TaxID=34773 RepID=UPI001C081081|nr:uncharacterized protein LOC121685760 isoform X2 [Alosa sapidissima]
MPSSNRLQERRHCNQPAQRSTLRAASRGSPVLQALRSVIWRGVQIVCDALKGADLNDEDAESPSQSLDDSTANRMFYSCYENLEDIRWGEERQQSDTELRTSTPVRNVYLPESRGDVHINTKLRAVRQAFQADTVTVFSPHEEQADTVTAFSSPHARQIIAHDTESRNFLKEAGLTILTGLLSLAGKMEGFTLVWDCLMAFAENPSNWDSITKECQKAGMQTPCFYDLFYEAIVLRLLECTDQVPPTLSTTIRTPWLSTSMKKTTVMFHAWARIRRDREQLTGPQGLYHHLCEVRDYIDPEIMWAAIGPQSDAKDFYFLLRGEVLSFVQRIFHLDTQSYVSPAVLAVHVFSAWRGLVGRLQEYLMEQRHTERWRRDDACPELS